MFVISKTKRNILLALLCLVCVVIGMFFLLQSSSNPHKATKSLEFYAKEMVDVCADAPHRPTCYEKEVPKLVSELPTERIFDVIRLIRAQDPEYLYCHVLAHELGRYEVSLDPDNWLNVVATGPTDGLCSNGYAHGALVTRFNDEDLSEEEFNFALKDLAIACEEREGFTPTDLSKAICYHGIGHVLIHMTLADVRKSLKGCEFIGLKDDGHDYRRLCTEGVYMQLFQPLEPEDFALVDLLPLAPSRDTLATFCKNNSDTDTQYGACWREGWPFFGNEIYDSEGVVAYCSQLSKDQDREACYVTAFTINGRHNLGYPDKMAATCNDLPLEYQGECFSRGANAFPEEDQNLVEEGVAMCGRAKNAGPKDECYNFLANLAAFNFHKGSEPFEKLCSALPVEYEDRCRNAN